MKELTTYALETLACSGVLLAAYLILLERRVRFGWCRAYLLLSTVAAALIPMLRIPVWPGPVIEAAPVVTAGVWDMQAAIVPDATAPTFAPETVAYAIYAFGAMLILSLMLWQALRIRSLRRGAVVTRIGKIVLVRTPKRIASFSFFRSIYIWQGVPDGELPAILAHETSHVRHRHSIERIVMECLKALLWWNPFAWIAARRLTEAEEFEADSDVLSNGFDVERYMHVILKQLFGYTPEIANGLRNSLTKKRFQMMTKKSSGRYALLRLAGTLPVAFGLLFAFSFTTRAAVVVLPETQPEEIESAATAATCRVTFVVSKDGTPLPGALVRIAGTERGTVTDPDGKAQLTAAPGTEFEISCVGCETKRTSIAPDEKNAEVMIVARLSSDGSAPAATAQTAATVMPKPARTGEAGKEKVRVHVTLANKDGKGFSSRNVAAGAIVMRPNTNVGTVTDSEGNAVIEAAKGTVLEVQFPDYAPTSLAVIDPKETHYVILYPAGVEPNKEVSLFSRDKDGVMQVPLYIVDGMERKNLSELETNNIHEITILKDKSATALYGERARNGVVIVTTERAHMAAQRAADEDQPFLVAETMPLFQGGDLNTFRQWVQSQVAYPAAAIEKNIQGRVVVGFVIERDGSLSNINFMQSPDKSLSEEVRRVLESTPAGSWTPGKQKGEVVRVKFLIPVDFRMQDASKELLPPPQPVTAGNRAVVVAETMPTFNDGNINAFRAWVQSRVRYPEAALKNNVQGRVVATFIVEKDGSLSNVEILQTPDKILSDEARRVIATAPAGSWKPGMEKGETVRVKYTMPIDFRIQGSAIRSTEEKGEKAPGSMDEIVVVGYGARPTPSK